MKKTSHALSPCFSRVWIRFLDVVEYFVAIEAKLPLREEAMLPRVLKKLAEELLFVPGMFCSSVSLLTTVYKLYFYF